jgi:polar amino acid transport system substrate-binding protein
MRKTILVLLVILVGITTATFFIYKDNSLTKIQEAGTIKIGYSIEAPYAFVKKNGEVTGLSTMEAKEIVNRLGIKNIEWRLMEFGSLINELESGKIDIIATGMFISNERAKRVNFSEPTFCVKQGLLVAKGNPKKLFSYQQIFKNKSLKIAIVEGSVEEVMLIGMGFNSQHLVLVPDVEAGKIAVETSLADAFVVSRPTLRQLLSNDKTNLVEIATRFNEPDVTLNKNTGYGAVQFQKNEVQLQNAWNKELKAFIGSPKHLELLAKFGFSKDELPGTISTEEIVNL